MNKLAFIVALLVITGSKYAYSQSITFVPNDTIQYDLPEGFIGMGNLIQNNTSDTILLDIVRVEDAKSTSGGPDWQTYFCFIMCYPPSVDSIRAELPPGGEYFIMDIITSTTPDSQSVLMKFNDVLNPGNTLYQRLHGVTLLGIGVQEEKFEMAKVAVYPAPVVSGCNFTMDIANIPSQEISLTVYSIYGNLVAERSNLTVGRNSLSLDLPPGLYTYSLLSAQTEMIKTGKIFVTR